MDLRFVVSLLHELPLFLGIIVLAIDGVEVVALPVPVRCLGSLDFLICSQFVIVELKVAV